MRIDRPQEEIAQDLFAAAVKAFGAKRAEALRDEVRTHSRHLSLLGKYEFPLDGDEPDFVVAPFPEVEAD